MAGVRLSDRDFAWVLGSLCQLHKVPFDPAVLLQQFPPPYDGSALLTAAKALDFRVGERSISGRDLPALPLPCVAFLKSENATPALIVKAGDKGFLYFGSGSNEPQQAPLAEFETRFAPEVILVGRTPAQANDPDAPLLERPPFGFRWFIPE